MAPFWKAGAWSLPRSDQGVARPSRTGRAVSVTGRQNSLTRPSASRRDRRIRAGIRWTASSWSGTSQRTCGYAGDVSGAVAGLMSDLPPALRALGSDAVVTEDGLSLWPSWEPSPPPVSDVGLAGRATRVPQVAVASGMQRSATVTPTGSAAWASGPDLVCWSRPKLHGMQEVRFQPRTDLPTPRRQRPVISHGGLKGDRRWQSSPA